METVVVFASQLVWFALAWSLVARFVVWPWSLRLSEHDRVALWIAPQMFRVLGLGLLVPNLSPGMPASFAVSTATGDSLTALLAVLGFVAAKKQWRACFSLAWACTIVGVGDGLLALVTAAQLEVAHHLAGQWYVPALGVPLMGVAHAGCIAALLRRRADNAASR